MATLNETRTLTETPTSQGLGPLERAPTDAPASREWPSFAAEEEVSAAPSLDHGGIRLYLQQIGRIPLLTIDEEIELARRIKRGDRAARDLMIRSNLRLVVKIAHDYKDFGLPVLDLISEGNIGLIKAVERFDPEKGGKLSTYAAWWIKQSIKRALANQSKTIRLPVHLVEKISRIRRAAAQLTEEMGREPADEELAEVLQMPVNKIAHLKSVSARPASLDAPLGDDASGAEFGDIVSDDRASTPFDQLREKSQQDDLADLIGALDGRESRIIQLRFGLDGASPLTLEQVGRQFSITRERVRQVQNIALAKMRRAMAERERQRTQEEIDELRRESQRLAALKEFVEQTRARAEAG